MAAFACTRCNTCLYYHPRRIRYTHTHVQVSRYKLVLYATALFQLILEFGRYSLKYIPFCCLPVLSKIRSTQLRVVACKVMENTCLSSESKYRFSNIPYTYLHTFLPFPFLNSTHPLSIGITSNGPPTASFKFLILQEEIKFIRTSWRKIVGESLYV